MLSQSSVLLIKPQTQTKKKVNGALHQKGRKSMKKIEFVVAIFVPLFFKEGREGRSRVTS